MNWNPFKRIAALESRNKGLCLTLDRAIERIDDLTFKLQAQGKDYVSKYTSLSIVLKEHDERLASLQNQLIYRDDKTRPGTPIKQDHKAEKRREYARKYYAKKRAAKAAEGGAK